MYSLSLRFAFQVKHCIIFQCVQTNGEHCKSFTVKVSNQVRSDLLVTWFFGLM